MDLAPEGDESETDTTRILFVCTANQCRSVLAEAFARRRFAGMPVTVASGGLIEGGRPMPPNGVLVARENGFDLSAHVSATVDVSRLGTWDVILTMTRQHARELVASRADLWPRVFTLPQFVRWLDRHPPDRHIELTTWVDMVGADRQRSEMIGTNPIDDIADPVNGPPHAWRQLASQLEADIDRIADHLTRARVPEDGERSDAHPAADAVAEG